MRELQKVSGSGKSIAGILIAFSMVFFSSQTMAGVTTHHTIGCSDFDNCDNSAFLAAIGGAPEFHLEFDVDKNGAAINDTNEDIEGDVYSDDVTFSSQSSSMVTHGGSGASYEIGPVNSFVGLMTITFTTPVSAVGFGGVEIDADAVITLSDGSTVILNTGGASNNTFDYLGFVSTDGDMITKIEIDDDFWAIQNLSFNSGAVAPSVPVPSMTTWGVVIMIALFGFVGIRSRKFI